MHNIEVYSAENINFYNGGVKLAGTVYLPKRKGPFPAVVYVAGSGPSGRDGYGTLPPLWEELARRGIASFAWDKPGVGESTGDWKAQTNQDRAREAIAAIQAIREREKIDPTKIGLWGISQAGWVLPVIYSIAPQDVAFLICVSVPVGTGAQQELYRVAHSLPADGFSQSDVSKAVAFTERRLALMEEKAPFADIEGIQKEVETEARFAPLGKLNQEAYEFLQANAFFSPRDLIGKIDCPVLVIFGEKDTIVNFRESARVYESLLKRGGNPNVTVKFFPNADHVIFPSKTGGGKELERSFQRSDKVFASGYLEAIGEWLQNRFVEK